MEAQNDSTDQVVSTKSYWGCMQQLLEHLSTDAPALRSLELFLLKDSSQDAASGSQLCPQFVPGEDMYDTNYTLPH